MTLQENGGHSRHAKSLSQNAARFTNSQYDKLVKQYVSALELQAKKQIAGQIQRLLLNETPLVIPSGTDGLIASTQNARGLSSTSIAQLYPNAAYKSA